MSQLKPDNDVTVCEIHLQGLWVEGVVFLIGAENIRIRVLGKLNTTFIIRNPVAGFTLTEVLDFSRSLLSAARGSLLMH